jgi:hypothetical protein
VAEARDYYGVLGVPRDADQKVINDAFRRLALEYHPDWSNGPGAAERFKEVARGLRCSQRAEEAVRVRRAGAGRRRRLLARGPVRGHRFRISVRRVRDDFGGAAAVQQGAFYKHPDGTPVKGVVRPLPVFEEVFPKLPQPILDGKPLYIAAYKRAWELAFRNFFVPTAANGFLSWYADAAFSEHIFLWDTATMVGFVRYGYGLVPGVESLDNFYAKQYPDGEIGREISRTDGKDNREWINDRDRIMSRVGFHSLEHARESEILYIGRTPPSARPFLTLDALNHPILALAELTSYEQTGDLGRLERVYAPLRAYYEALHMFLEQGNGLYLTDWGSFDNSPRNPGLAGGGVGVDISSEMAVFAEQLIKIARLTGHDADIPALADRLHKLRERIRTLMWSAEEGFFLDLRADGSQSPVKSIAGFFPLLAGAADDAQIAQLLEHLFDPRTFGRDVPVPSVSADTRGYDPEGRYWAGGVWPSTNMLVLEGLERTQGHEIARTIARRYLAAVNGAFGTTNTFWECYAPDDDPGNTPRPGTDAEGRPCRANFVGWSGLAPIRYLIEYEIGIRASAPEKKVYWDLRSDGRAGIRNFRFGNGNAPDGIGEAIDINTDLVARPTPGGEAYLLSYRANAPYTLVVTNQGGVVLSIEIPRTEEERELHIPRHRNG